MTDDELFGLYKDFGDQTGKLKLLVSHTSASVHEPGPYDPPLTSTVNTIPPPVLPQQTLYAPLRPNRDTRIRQGSQSSASEPRHAEVGYQASISDDLDHGDGDGGLRDARDYGRPPLPVRALPIPTYRPPSPSGYHRSRSPTGLLSPERRHDPYHASIGAFPLPGTSPQASRFVDDHHPLPPLPPEVQAPSLLDPPVEQRERSHTNDGQISTYNGGFRGKEERGREQRERGKRRETARKDSGRYTKPEQEDTRPRNDAWTIVPGDVPSSEYRKDRPRTPQESRSNARLPITSPSAISSYRNAQGESSVRRKPLQVPLNWPVNWKHIYAPPKSDSKPVQSPPGNNLMRHGAKSMTDMRGAYKHPPSLQPGRPPRAPPPQPPLPLITRPSTGGSLTGVLGGPPLPSASSSSDASTVYPDQIASASDIARSVLSSRQITTSYANSPATTTGGYLTSPSQQDPFPRPHSALGEPSSAPLTQPRYSHSNQPSEPPYAQRTPPCSPVAQPTPVTAQSLPSESPATPGGLPGDGLAKRGALDEDSGTQTVRADDCKWLEGFIDENLAGGTARPRPKQPAPVQQLPTPTSTTEITTMTSTSSATCVNGAGQNDDDSDSDGGTSFWLVPPKKSERPAESQQSSNASKTRPPLTPLSIESSPNSTPNGLPAVNSYDYGRSPPNHQLDFLASPPSSSAQPRTPRRMPAQKKHKDRISKFDNNFDMTWAPRPPPEVMYEKLEEYFPEHDLDKPVIETPSGGTSPIATEVPANPAPQRFKHKKSIRLVAAEHKRQLDRTSRGDDSTIAPMSRKRHTKMWGGKLEEVTTEQGTGPISSTADASPGGAKREWLIRSGFHGQRSTLTLVLLSYLPLGTWRADRKRNVRPCLPSAERDDG